MPLPSSRNGCGLAIYTWEAHMDFELSEEQVIVTTDGPEFAMEIIPFVRD